MSIWRKHIPTILGLLVLIMGMAGGIYLVQREGFWSLKAEPEAIPKGIKITNVSDNSFTVSWLTGKKVVGFIKYGLTPSLEKTSRDERDILSGKTSSFFIHHVKISGLKGATKYYFKIGSGKKVFDNNGSPYMVSTAPTLATLPPADTVYGTILKADGSPAEGVIVYLSLANSTPLSALTKSDGSWTIPLSMARTAELSSYLNYDPDASVEEIFVQGGSLGTATAVSATKNDSPVPIITLGETYDFRETKGKTEAKAESAPEPTAAPVSKFVIQPLGTPSAVEEELVIINPEESEKIATDKPEFQGKGPANRKIKIVLKSAETLTAEVVINEDGTWSWTPPSNLSPGEHTITAVLDDGTTVSHSFEILASGAQELPAFTATPSAEEASPSPTIAPLPTPSATPTAVPRKTMPSTESGVPTSGILTPTLIFAILGISLTLTGLFLNFKLNFN